MQQYMVASDSPSEFMQVTCPLCVCARASRLAPGLATSLKWHTPSLGVGINKHRTKLIGTEIKLNKTISMHKYNKPNFN